MFHQFLMYTIIIVFFAANVKHVGRVRKKFLLFFEKSY